MNRPMLGASRLAMEVSNPTLALERIDFIEARVPLFIASDRGRPSIHRFYDTSPISPSGRFLAYLELPFEDRAPNEDDCATVIVVDLRSGQRREIGSTSAWDTQVGAQVQWGGSDEQLFYNMRDRTERIRAISYNLFTGREQYFNGPVYMISPDGTRGLCPNLLKIGLVQKGYGVRLADQERYRHVGAPEDDGLYLLDASTGTYELILSLSRVAKLIEGYIPTSSVGGLYGFHAKWDSSAKWAMFMVRWLSGRKTGGTTRNFLLALNVEDGELRLVVDPSIWGNGHHPNWWPNQLDVIMNLPSRRRSEFELLAYRAISRLARHLRLSRIVSNRLSFVRINVLTGERSVVAAGLAGSGHPSIDPTGRFLVTDAYPSESVASGDGRVPIRLVNLSTGQEICLAKVDSKPTHTGSQDELRIDAHPAWSRCGRFLTMNTVIGGVRSVVVADVAGLVG